MGRKVFGVCAIVFSSNLLMQWNMIAATLLDILV